MLALRLPDCPDKLPDETFIGIPATDIATKAQTPVEIHQVLQAAIIQRQPEVIAGSDSTPVLWWLLASQHLPQAQHWCYIQASQQWLPLHQAAVAKTNPPPETPTPDSSTRETNATPQDNSSEAAPAKAPDSESVTNKPAIKSDSKLIQDTFLRAAWGPTPEHIRELERLEQEALQTGRPRCLHKQFESAKRDGEKAYKLGQKLRKVLNTEGLTAAEQWIDRESEGQHKNIAKHLKIVLDKARKYQQEKQQQLAVSRKQHYKSNIGTQLRAGQHPNSLRHQQPASHWRIYIDETGQIFDNQVDTLSPNNKDVGRIVALAIPKEMMWFNRSVHLS